MRSVAKAATNVHRNFVHGAIRTVQYIGDLRSDSLSRLFSIRTILYRNFRKAFRALLKRTV